MPIIFEPTAALLAAQQSGSIGSPADGSGLAPSGLAQIWIAASGAGANWGGCQIWLSFDNTTFKQIGTIIGPAKQGVLTANLAAYSDANPDTSDTLAINLAMSGTALSIVPGSDADARDGRTLCYVDGEVIAYGLATPTAGDAYGLTDLYRGLYGTTASAHPSGAAFAFLDDAIFEYNLPASYVGVPLYFKFPSFNVWGGGLQDLSAVTAVTYVVTGAGVTFSNSPFMSILYNGATISLGDITSPVNAVFECGDIGGTGEILQLGII